MIPLLVQHRQMIDEHVLIRHLGAAQRGADLALVHHIAALGQVHDQLDILLDEKHRGAKLAIDALDIVADLLHQVRLQPL